MLTSVILHLLGVMDSVANCYTIFHYHCVHILRLSSIHMFIFRCILLNKRPFSANMLTLNALAPVDFIEIEVISKLILVIDWCLSSLKCISLDPTDDKSSLLKIMAWCRQATSHCLNQHWPRSMSPHGISNNYIISSFTWSNFLQKIYMIIGITLLRTLNYFLFQKNGGPCEALPPAAVIQGIIMAKCRLFMTFSKLHLRSLVRIKYPRTRTMLTGPIWCGRPLVIWTGSLYRFDLNRIKYRVCCSWVPL